MAHARYYYNLVLAALAALVTDEERREEFLRRRRRRRWWVRPWIARRPIYGQYEQLMEELRKENPADLKSFLRVEPDLFFELVRQVGPRIEKSAKGRAPLQPGLKLAITLRFLATGNSFRSLGFSFRVAHNTISIFIPEVCQAIVEEYRQEVFDTQSTPDEWRRKAKVFQDRWNFPHACGALDGKHVAIRKPAHSGSIYYNYKGYYSIVMLVLSDREYNALWADVGSPGSQSDCGIFNRSGLLRSLTSGAIGFPPPEPLPNDDGYRVFSSGG
ncbi:putative nuclease HARBI1 [Diadema setosum]|uniref:putative nuclease HARBI1 n=1 Tax=Diadema setosum TaxID=31175 RepID=UPI003B3B0BDE